MKRKRFTTQQLALDAMLAAVCAVLGYYGPDLGNLKITFEGLPVILAALLLGPADGAAVGGIGTLLYQVLRYGITATTPLWILPYVFCGLLVGRIGDRFSPERSYPRLALAVLAGEGLIFLLNTLVIYLDSKIYGYYSAAYVFGSFFVRMGICAAKTLLYAAVLPALLSGLRRAGAPSRKAIQRRQAISARKALGAEARADKSAAICEKLLALPQLRQAQTVLSYMALPDEVDLTALHEALGARGVRLCFPVSLPDGVLEIYEPGSWKQGPYGIREPDPAHSRPVAPEELDLVIAPCVAFDARRNRLGHGAGYYDRFLPRCGRAAVLSPAFECQKLPAVNAEAHDRRLDAVVTERTVY